MTKLKIVKDNGETITARRSVDTAYAALEPDICDLVQAAQLASIAEDQNDDGLVTFAIGQFQKMALELRARYYELWKD